MQCAVGIGPGIIDSVPVFDTVSPTNKLSHKMEEKVGFTN